MKGFHLLYITSHLPKLMWLYWLLFSRALCCLLPVTLCFFYRCPMQREGWFLAQVKADVKLRGRAVTQVTCRAQVPARTPHQQPIHIPKVWHPPQPLPRQSGGVLGIPWLPSASFLRSGRKNNHGLEWSFLLFASPSIPESPGDTPSPSAPARAQIALEQREEPHTNKPWLFSLHYNVILAEGT